MVQAVAKDFEQKTGPTDARAPFLPVGGNLLTREEFVNRIVNKDSAIPSSFLSYSDLVAGPGPKHIEVDFEEELLALCTKISLALRS